MDMIGKIRRLSRRQKKLAREISRLTGLSRNTVAKWLRGEIDGAPKYRWGVQPNKLTAFQDAFIRALKTDAHWLKRELRTAKALLLQLKSSCYCVGCTRVADFVHAWLDFEG